MKKTISIISLVLVLVILTACLVGCAPANENKAKAKLEKKGYTVEIMSGEEMSFPAVTMPEKRWKNAENSERGKKNSKNLNFFKKSI